MGVLDISKLFTGSGTAVVRRSTGAGVSASRGVNQSFKNASYASVPYERAPQVLDTVPTKDAYGRPLLPGYSTPGAVWTC